MDGDMNKKHFKKEKQPFVCPKCGHNEAVIDSFAAIPSVRRAVAGNVICAKCSEPVAGIID